jgi:hypothetical protein
MNIIEVIVDGSSISLKIGFGSPIIVFFMPFHYIRSLIRVIAA